MKAGYLLLRWKVFNDPMNRSSNGPIRRLGTQCRYKSDYDSVFICQIVRFMACGCRTESELPDFLFAVGLSVF